MIAVLDRKAPTNSFYPSCDPSCRDCSLTVERFELPPGNLFPLGTTEVTCTATDSGDNVEVCLSSVTVVCAAVLAACASTADLPACVEHCRTGAVKETECHCSGLCCAPGQQCVGAETNPVGAAAGSWQVATPLLARSLDNGASVALSSATGAASSP